MVPRFAELLWARSTELAWRWCGYCVGTGLMRLLFLDELLAFCAGLKGPTLAWLWFTILTFDAEPLSEKGVESRFCLLPVFIYFANISCALPAAEPPAPRFRALDRPWERCELSLLPCERLPWLPSSLEWSRFTFTVPPLGLPWGYFAERWISPSERRFMSFEPSSFKLCFT